MTRIPQDILRLAIDKGKYDYLNPNTRIECPICEESYNCHYQLAVIQRVVIPNKDEVKSGKWHWKALNKKE